MPTDDPKVLEHLRGMFLEELEDQVAVVNAQLVTLDDAGAEPATRHDALQEAYRATHSLKGAAGAVGFSEPERICHDLEEALGAARNEDSPDFRELVRQIGSAVAALTTWAHQSSGPGPQPMSSAPPSGGEGSTSTASGSVRPVEAGAGASVRVRVSGLDKVLESVNEYAQTQPVATHSDVQAAIDLLEDFFVEERELDTPAQRVRYLQTGRRLLTELRQRYRREVVRRRAFQRAITLRTTDIARQLRNLRLQPVSQIGTALEQAVLEGAKSEGKQVRFALSGGEAEADYGVIERLREPLLHLVRNAVAHGIETPSARAEAGKPEHGSVRVNVETRGAELRIRVEDDGQGIAVESLKHVARQRGLQFHEPLADSALLDLVCTVGLSTRSHADHQAGRGIGMDLVKDRVERLHGQVRLSSTPGRGTSVVLDVPVDLALLEVLLLSSGKELFAIATTHIRELRRVTARDFSFVEDVPFIRDGDELVSVSDFRMVVEGARLKLDAHSNFPCVLVEAGDTVVAFAAEEFVAVDNFIVKPLNDRSRVPLSQAALVLPDGRVAPLLNPYALCAAAAHSSVQWIANEGQGDAAKPRVLIVDDSVTTRQLVRILLEAAGYLVESAANGEQAWVFLRSGTRFDAIVSDIEMPVMNGLELLAKVRASARFRELPVILVTALARDEDRRQALDLGADAYVVKSRFDQQTLLDTLQELVA